MEQPSLESELGVPDDASLDPPTVKVSLVTSSGVVIQVAQETCTRPQARSIVLGRQPVSDIRVQHKSISRKHAVLYFIGNQLYLKDLGGKYGTFVNDTKVDSSRPVALNGGDSILFGNVRESVFQVKVESKEGSDPENKEQQEEERPVVDDQALLEKAGEGKTGREKREAEIAAMMSSFEAAPTYQKFTNVQEELPETAKEEEGDNETIKIAKKYKLPVTKVFTLESESERRNATTCIAIDTAGARFVVGSTDTHLRFFDFGGMATNRAESFRDVIPDDGYLLVDCCFSNTGDKILVATSNLQPLIFGRDGEEIIKFVRGDVYVQDQAKTVGHTAAVTSTDWHPLEPNTVLTGSSDGSARLWNLKGKTQFEMLVCDKVFQAKSEKGQRTAVTSVCFHPGGREFACGTACGSIQIWNRSRSSGRPERVVFQAHGNSNSPITYLVYNFDGSMIASRSSETDSVHVWNAQRLSRSSRPIATCKGLESVFERANACFSPDGSMLCACMSFHRRLEDSTVASGCVKFFSMPPKGDSTASLDAVLSLDLDQYSAPVVVKWHAKLNQIFIGCSDGKTLVLYDPKRSSKGAVIAAKKSVKGVDVLSELLRSRAPTGSAAISGEIVTPFSLPMFREEKPDKKRKRDEAKEREPERPATGKHKAGSQAGGGVTLQQFVADQRIKKKAIASQDPREALLKYKADDDKVQELADTTAEEEEQKHSKK